MSDNLLFVILVVVFFGLSVIVGGLIASYFYSLGRRHNQPNKLAEALSSLVLDEDGLPQANTYPPGNVEECLRCQVPTECGVITSIGDPFTGRLLNGPICRDCFAMQFKDPATFWPLMRKRVQEEFRGQTDD